MTIFTAEVAKQQMNIDFQLFKIYIVDLNELIICTILHELFLSELLFILFFDRLFLVLLFLTNRYIYKKALKDGCILTAKAGYYALEMSSHTS